MPRQIDALPQGPPGAMMGTDGSLALAEGGEWGSYLDSTRGYGELVCLEKGPPVVLLCNQPDWILETLRNPSYELEWEPYPNLQLMLADSFMTLQGEAWRKERRLLQPAFSKRTLSTYAGPPASLAKEEALRWLEMGEVNIQHELKLMNCRAQFATMLGVCEPALASEMAKLYMEVIESFSTEDPDIQQQFELAYGKLNVIVDAMIEAFRQQDEGLRFSDSSLMQWIVTKEPNRTDRQLRSDLWTFLVAGNGPTGRQLGYTLYLLAEHPEAQERVWRELGSPREGGGMSYLQAVVHESLRLYPAASKIERVVCKEVELGGCILPVGTVVTISPWVTQRSPQYWKDPTEFKPERWLDGSTKRLHPGLFFPFGQGPRKCIGADLALQNLPLELGELLRTARFSTIPARPWKTALTRPGQQQMGQGIWLRVEPR